MSDDIQTRAFARNGYRDLFGHESSQAYPDAPGFKSPGTSAEAARAIEPLASKLRSDALAEFKAAHPGGLTADQCAKRLGKSPLAIRPRCSELKRAGLLEATKERRANDDSGLSAAVLRASALAMQGVAS